MEQQGNPTVVVIGNGMVGYKFCEKLLAKSTDFNLVVFGEEPRVAYDRVHLSEYFGGKTADDLLMAPTQWYHDNGITLHLGDAVQEIDRASQTVHARSGLVQPYDYLVLATGSSAFVPDIPGVEKQGVMVYRTIEDLDQIKAYAATARRGAVLGGGLLGLEAAKALLDLGVDEAHVVEFAPRLMPRQIDAAGSAMLQSKLEALGLQIHLSKVTSSVGGNGKIDALHFGDGSILEVDMLVISAGIRPRDELARLAGLEVGLRGGIVVNDAMQTSDPHVFAIGECALHSGMIYGLVAPGYDMAEVVVSQLIKGARAFSGFDMSSKLKLIGVDVASFGDPFIAEPHSRAIVYEDAHNGIYKRINISPDGKYLLGGVLVGEAEAYNMLLQTVNNKILLPPHPEDLILGARGGEGSDSGNDIMSLPDTVLVCSCEGITKGQICEAVETQGVTDVPGMKKCTKAGTGCGGCVPMVKDLINGTLTAQGAYIKNVLCEHFDYSRQELFDLLRINDLHTYDEALDRFGCGDGCEVCKPAIGSILAGLWNDLIIKQNVIQDTNDRYLANIQKGGSYSVMPRMAGGEVSPQQLMTIGRIAEKYNLYTKITGGQRIDMFGAHVSDLPDIWEELVNAGFESGHAYGKSLRTIKSCVGSTWCRYGLHDSVSFAIELENRYKGIRSPHKMKSGVSGCVRECAEAQAKDFGVIATEKGWNLYVCGNGGAKPQHAQLLAGDIDKETLVKYLDRFLMFYIKTADPLMRTATWLNKLDGGMAYLKNVIINDSLGICADLEAEIALLIANYHCEWRKVVEDPELRKQFTHFVNVPKSKDPTMEFAEHRGQKMSTAW